MWYLWKDLTGKNDPQKIICKHRLLKEEFLHLISGRM
jgi:hypothetical protein